jgi:colicin import membrane protein
MLETRIKILASLYTAILIAAVIGLLLFGGFQFKSEPIKGQTIQAIMVDISQLNIKKSNKKSRNISKPVKKQEPQKPKIKTPKKVEKKQPQPAKKKKAIIPKQKEPKIDTKALEKERKEQKERERKKKNLAKRKLENKKKLEKAKRDLEALANKTKKPTETNNPVTTGTVKGKSEADKRNELKSLWINAVQSAVYQQWSQPASTKQDMQCSVKVRQIPGGAVVNVSIASPCNASEIVKKSITDAIMKAEPLPYKGFEKVFDRNASFTFKAQE